MLKFYSLIQFQADEEDVEMEVEEESDSEEESEEEEEEGDKEEDVKEKKRKEEKTTPSDQNTEVQDMEEGVRIEIKGLGGCIFRGGEYHQNPRNQKRWRERRRKM